MSPKFITVIETGLIQLEDYTDLIRHGPNRRGKFNELPNVTIGIARVTDEQARLQRCIQLTPEQSDPRLRQSTIWHRPSSTDWYTAGLSGGVSDQGFTMGPNLSVDF